ncbi:MobF family relaxase [Nocardia carnea]|uniref:MobF family relaxase n=1 Tax=Nocardia carnea TaxID=37328 RepID=UPI0024588EF9|nr:MobF family relaxase [Nocardia carnea]
MMTIHALHGGDGYEYLTRQVAVADRELARGQGLTDYYNEHGTPPGVWAGRGAELMGVSGNVTEAQMRSLYGEGRRPDADERFLAALQNGATAEEAMATGNLGTGLYQFAGGVSEIQRVYERRKAEFLEVEQRSPSRDEWIGLRTESAREALTESLGRAPDVEEIKKALFDEKRKSREAVVGWDCVFTPQKSVSILWGLGDDQLRRDIWRCHEEAVREVTDRMEQTYALVRRGKGGKKRLDGEGLTFAKFQHYDNRTGDMNPHTHVVASSRVLGSDGKWSSLHATPLVQATVSLSCEYNAALVGKLKRELGLKFEERSRGRGKQPVLEVVGISNEMIDQFSRRRDIMARTEELVREYRQIHGCNPSKATQLKMAQQATLDTRAEKPLPKSLREMISEWDHRAARALGDGRTGQQYAADIVRLSRDPNALLPYDPQRIALDVGVTVGGRDIVTALDAEDLRGYIAETMQGYQSASEMTVEAAEDQVFDLLQESSNHHVLDRIEEEIEARDRTVYDPDKIAADVLETVSRRRATWVETHIRAAAEDRLAVCDFASDAEHRQAVEHIVAAVRDQHSVQLTVDPDPVPAALARRNGELVFEDPAATTVRYSSEAVLAADRRLQKAAHEPTAEFLTQGAVEAAIAVLEDDSRARTLGVRHGQARRMKAGQRRIVEHFCGSGARLAVAVGPAGTGKTTALKAVVRAWQSDGRTVVALSPQMSSARVLGDEIGVRAQTIDALITKDRMGVDLGLARGTMILVDEAGMASNRNLDALQTIADKHGAVVRWIGDPHQISAVESGGALGLIARDTKAPVLDEVVRFTSEDEAAATLKVRDGNAGQAWEFYDENDRVTSGMVDELREKILAAHLNDVDAGRSSLMMAATVDDVYALNGAAQSVHAMRGTIQGSGASTRLADGHHGYIGDTVVTRRNDSRLRITGKGRRASTPVDNGDLWTIQAIKPDGSLAVTGIGHNGRVTLPARYVRDYTELGYASTVHRAQGMTVDRGHLLMNKVLGRSLAYVGLTRGRSQNHIYVATDALPDPDLDRIPDEPAEERAMFLRVLAREDDNLTATEILRAEQARIADPARTRDLYTAATEILGRARVTYSLDRALPAAIHTDIARSDHYTALLDTLALADTIGMDTSALIADIVTRGGTDFDSETLVTARDAATVLWARADAAIEKHATRTETSHASLAVETLAVSPTTDTDQLTALTAERNTHEALATRQRGGGRFVALRDLERPAIPLLPSRHPGMDIELADYAAELRARLLGDDTARLPGNRPTVPTGDQAQAALDSYTALPVPDRRQRIQADYHHYIDQLAHDRARYLLDRALPVVLMRHVESGRSWQPLLDTLAVAENYRLDTTELIGHITSDGGRDDGNGLLRARDAAALLRARADQWIEEHTIPVRAAATLAPVDTLALDGSDPAPLTAAVAATNTGADVLAHAPATRAFRALDDLPTPAGLRPIPPEHPGMNTAVADYADELRRRLLDLPADTPDWRERAASEAAPTVEDLDVDIDDWTPVDRPVDLPYPDLDPADRLRRIRADIAAARAQEALLINTVMYGTSPHMHVIAPIIDELRTRRDELAPLVGAERDARAEWEEAELDAAAADDTYQQALRSNPEPIDESFLTFMEGKIADAAGTDPATHARLTAALEELRTTETERAASQHTAEIAAAREAAEIARARATELRAVADTARAELDAATGGRPAVERMDVEYVRQLAGELGAADLMAIREGTVTRSAQERAARIAAIEALVEAGTDVVDAAAEVDRYQPSTAEIEAAMPAVLGRSRDDQALTTALTGPDITDAALESGRRRAHTIGGYGARALDDEPLTRLVRARVDALMPAAVAAHTAQIDANATEFDATNLEQANERTSAKELSEFSSDETLLAHLENELAKLDPNSPQHTQMAALLEQHRNVSVDLAATELAAEKAAAARAADQARDVADQHAAQSAAARRAYEQQLDQLTTPDASAPTTAAAPEPEPAAEPDHGPEPSISDPEATHQTQVLADMRAEPIRMRSDAQLDQLIRTLRRTANRQDATTLPGQPRQPRVEQVRTAHAQLAEQADAIRDAQHAHTEADAAETAATAAARAVATATTERDALPAIRVSARRAAQQRIDELTAAQQRADTVRDNARATAREAANAARAAGAPQPQWVTLLARADDRAALAAELQQAQQADDRDEEIRRRNTERATRAADDLQKALAERDRRSALAPIDAAIEHQLRATHTPTQRQTGPSLEEQAAHLQAEQDHGRDHGPEL